MLHFYVTVVSECYFHGTVESKCHMNGNVTRERYNHGTITDERLPLWDYHTHSGNPHFGHTHTKTPSTFCLFVSLLNV